MSEPRSWLFVPADSERKIAKALDSEADAIIFDLEDSVAPAMKPVARDILKNMPKRSGGPQWWVRVNPLGSEFIKDDLELIGIADIHGIVLPKAESGADVTQLAHRTGNIPIHAIVTETAASLFGLLSYRDPKSPLAAMSWGAEDLSAALGASSKYDADGELSFTYRLARSLCLAGAVAAGVQPVDGVFADFKDEDGLRAEAEAARREGFTGKLAIHPAQVADHQRRLHAVRAEDVRTPRKSSPRSRHIPTQACFRSAAKWSTARISSRPGAYWNEHDRRLDMATTAEPATRDSRPSTSRPPPKAGAPTRPTSRCGRWSSNAARFAPTMSRSRSPTPASATAISTPAATTGKARTIRSIPGHEIVGTVTAVGDEVTRHRVGDTVAVGCMVDSCMECDQCLAGWEVFCRKGCVQTYNSADYHDGTIIEGRLHRPYRRPRPFRPEGARRHGRQPRRAVALRRDHDLLAAAPVQCRPDQQGRGGRASAGSATWA